MQRRRLGLALMLLAFAVLIAVKPRTGEIRLSLNTGNDTAPAQAEAALEVGVVAVSLLVRQAQKSAR